MPPARHARPRGIPPVVLVLAVLSLLVAACGTGETTVSGTTTAGPTTSTTTSTAEPGEEADPVGAGGLATVESRGFPAGGPVALLEDVRLGNHTTFDRVVFDFAGDSVPSYRVAYIEPPVVEDGSGREVEVAGEAFLEVRMTPASGVDLSGGEVRTVYEGAERLPGGDALVIEEVVLTGDFEAMLTWVVGVGEEVPFAVAAFEQGDRLVVDVHAPTAG